MEEGGYMCSVKRLVPEELGNILTPDTEQDAFHGSVSCNLAFDLIVSLSHVVC